MPSNGNEYELPPTSHSPQTYVGPGKDEVLRLRQEFLSPALLLYYTDPMMIVEGKMQYVWDEAGKRYLDAFGGIASPS